MTPLAFLRGASAAFVALLLLSAPAIAAVAAGTPNRVY